MSDIELKRLELKKAFPGKKWASKVNKMPKEEVIAVHKRLKAQNKV